MVKSTAYLKYFEPVQEENREKDTYEFCSDTPGLLAYRDGEKLFIGQVRTEKNTSMTSKSEILHVLDRLEPSSCLVTINAFNINMEVSRKLRSMGADYVIALKGKHQNLYVDAVEYFQDILSAEAEEFKYDSVISMARPEGTKAEERTCYTSTDISWLHYRRDWADIKSLAMIVREVKDGSKLIRKAGYYVSNLEDAAEHFIAAARTYWNDTRMIWWICVEERTAKLGETDRETEQAAETAQ